MPDVPKVKCPECGRVMRPRVGTVRDPQQPVTPTTTDDLRFMWVCTRCVAAWNEQGRSVLATVEPDGPTLDLAIELARQFLAVEES